jgi:DNA-binding transcriptional ArsR family regulator
MKRGAAEFAAPLSLLLTVPVTSAILSLKRHLDNYLNVEKKKRSSPNQGERRLAIMGDAFKALADPTRRHILELLSSGEMTAGDIAAQFQMAKPSISHHLSILKAAGLVTDERRGQNIVYCLNLTVFQELMKWFYDMGFAKGGENNEK